MAGCPSPPSQPREPAVGRFWWGAGSRPWLQSASRGRHYLRVYSQRLVRLRGVCRHIVVWACATTMNTEELPLQALDQRYRGPRRMMDGRSRAPQRPRDAIHRHGIHHQGWGTWHASLDRHGRRLVRQRHGRKRQRRVQDRAGVAAQAVCGSEGAGTGDVPVGLVVELEAPLPITGLQDAGSGGNRVLCKSRDASRFTMKAEKIRSHHFGLMRRNRHERDTVPE